jgi:DNA (cytosine-5)-methyltransferase 1
MLRVLDIFSGIGGFALGLEAAGGFSTIAFCEIEEYPCQVLAKHWPDVPIYNDVRELTYDRLKADGITDIDVLCGGFPCTDISNAGTKTGIGAETRSGLWSECARLLGEIRPRYAIFENVTALLTGDSGRWFEQVLWDISEVGYNAEWHCIPASELGAHHHRDRVWILCYPNPEAPAQLAHPASSHQPVGQHESQPEGSGAAAPQGAGRTGGQNGTNHVADTASQRQPRQGEPDQSLFAEAYRQGQAINALSGGQPRIWAVEPDLDRVANGVPDSVAKLTALGNAVCPPVVELLGRAIMADYAYHANARVLIEMNVGLHIDGN